MNFHVVPASMGKSQSQVRDRDAATDATWIFGHAIHHCRQLLSQRGQTVTIGNASLHGIAPIQHDPLARLLALAIGDISSVSSRGGDLSLGACGNAIVIQSAHPLDIPGDGLAIDERLRDAAPSLAIAIVLAWDAGRGPRLTLSLPPEAGSMRQGGFAQRFGRSVARASG